MVNTSVSTAASVVNIETINEFERQKYIGIIAFLVILMLSGIIGNILVLIVYKTKFKRSSARVYILSLALADLSVCIVGIPYHVLDLWMQLTYTNTSVCKTLSYFISACSMSSVFILLVVGLDRFLKVCRPLKKQIIDFGDRKACTIATAVACLINIPNGILYGPSSVINKEFNVTGIECFIDDDYVESGLATGYLGLYLLIFIVSVFYLIVVYGLICRKIYQKDQSNVGIPLTKAKYACLCCRADDNEGVDDEGTEVIDNGGQAGHTNDIAKDQQQMSKLLKKENENDTSQEGLSKDAAKVSKGASAKQNKSQSKSKIRSTIHKVSSAAMIRHVATGTKSNEKNTRKITLMMFTITVVFITTYLPFIVISILDSIDDEFWSNLSGAEIMIVDFLLRFYLFHNVANPIIYCFWDARFRREVIKLFRRLLCCCVSDVTGGDSSDSKFQATMHSTYKHTGTQLR